MTVKPKHAKLAPSASSRWMNCPASIALEAKYPELPESEYAEEGTAAHSLAERCLRENLDAFMLIGTEIDTSEGKDDGDL